MKNTRKHRDNKKLFMTDELKSIHNIRMIKFYNKKNPRKIRQNFRFTKHNIKN